MEKTNPFLSIEREETEGSTTVHLKGVIDENSNLENIIGQVKPKLRVGCKGVTRVNSFGVRHWIKYFRKLTDLGVKYTFFECSPIIVDQMNTVGDFRVSGKVESIYLPYICSGCKKSYFSLYKMKSLEKGAKVPKLPDIECPICHSTMKFDDIPEDYFSAFRR